MPNKAELIAILTAHGPRLDEAPGGIPTLTQMDVAAMFRWLSRKEQCLLLAKYADDTDARNQSWAYLYKEIAPRGWKHSERLASSALDEYLSDLVCKTCGGIGRLLSDAKIIPCEPCGGIGRRHWSNREFARSLGLKSSLQSPLKERVEWIRKHLRMTEMSALERLQ